MAKKVLICDDDLHILRAAEFKLKRAGFEVRCAGDGQEAWELVRQERPDMIVTDCQMPRLDGLGLAQRVHSTPETTGIPLVMLTAKGLELPHEQLVEELAVIAVLNKPFSPRELLKIVGQIIETGAYQPHATCEPTCAF
jgi:two-component system alkaline phosphatase synthesis response regulator PhoP